MKFREEFQEAILQNQFQIGREKKKKKKKKTYLFSGTNPLAPNSAEVLDKAFIDTHFSTV